ncbi:SAM-dependent methyltransferase [Rhodoligotrophos defluvii]|uniref:SAM-dependent methyltransferase n=1 Tax=Rhodoligotrophos defluvii TaxID=2561934 RepID=UPI0010C94490|nr:SAM-dependent methyltransferase [Rhodoligotrophos defluvii]
MTGGGFIAPMEGHGAYNRSSSVQAAGSAPALPLFVRAAREVALPPGREWLLIADYGSSEGRNSLAPVAAAIPALRERTGAERAISVVHIDQPSSDFSSLFQVLNQDPARYLHQAEPTFAFAVGRSFYDQVLPSASVTLGWSSWAVQWLSRSPGSIPDHVQVAYSADETARAAYARQADEDWRTFLLRRARELRPGGRLVVETMALDATGAFGYEAVLAALYGALLDLAEQGLITMAEVRRMALPVVARSRADLMAPFAETGSFQGLSVEHLDIFHGEDRLWRQFEADGDAHAFAAGWTAFLRAAVFPTLALGLEPGRGNDFPRVFMNALASVTAERLGGEPQRTVIPLAVMVLAREGLSSKQGG